MVTSKPLQTKHWLALLAILFVMVLIAHLAIITSARDQFSNQKSEQIKTFSTRTIELPAPTPVVEKIPEVVTSTKPVRPATKALTAPPVAQDAPALLSAPTSKIVAATAPLAELIQPASTTPPVTLANPINPDNPVTPVATAPPASVSGESGLPPPAFVALNTGRHTYKVTFTKNGVVNQGDAEMVWQQDGKKYVLNMLATYTLLIKTFNVFEQNSSGMVTPQGLQPLRFSDKRLNRSEVAAHFDYASEKIVFSANKPEVMLQAGAQDRISVIWQLAGLLAAQPSRYPPGSTLTIQTASASDAEPWLFTVNEPETLNLPTGSHIALRLTRNPRREFDQKIELWFATGLNHLPARFRFTETNGDYVDAVWQSIKTLPN
jgi:hypothetical protein